MNFKSNPKTPKQKGSIIVSILVSCLFLVGFISGVAILANSNLARAKLRIYQLQAQYAAESGADAAIATLNSGNTAYTGTTSEVELLSNTRYRSTYIVAVGPGTNDKEKIIQATGKVYAPKGSGEPISSRKIEVISQRSSQTTTSSIVSRNVLYVESGVKNITARDVFINGFIHLSKNTTNLIAENITVVDKNTSASNCSIGGSGNLIKPTSFSDPGQTRTKLITGYNVCINPPGNNTNSNFEVLANQNNLGKVQSTLIPWSQYMDNDYQDSPSGCTDWTTGTSPIEIPRTGFPKKTHYPNSSSGTASSCGVNGSLELGSLQYNINDHVHVRANLCAQSACKPIFNNPTTDPKFIFIEGSVNLDSVRTSPGSGPIIFMAYGADPIAKAASCPYGGSVYLGQGSPGSYTNAPDLYFVAVNGICLDKTKFGAQPALGGVSAKNIFVATSSGTPFDLALDPLFPTDQIPVDLSWRATRYKRL